MSLNFTEIRRPEIDKTTEDPYTLAYVAEVEPSQCSKVVKRVQSLTAISRTSFDLGHLKRVKKVTTSSELVEEPLKKKKRVDVRLYVLLGQKNALDEHYNDEGNIPTEDVLRRKFALSNVETMKVPARSPSSQGEWTEFNQVWPTNLYAETFDAFREEQLMLTENDISLMNRGISEAILDAQSSSSFGGVIVMSPDTASILSRSSEEASLQHMDIQLNPLATPTILAIQGVSRKEREAAKCLGMANPTFQKGQYICTGLDVYTVREPTAFEAMALVHSRIRRLIFKDTAKNYVGGITQMYIHDLPGTNHKFRAFQCNNT